MEAVAAQIKTLAHALKQEIIAIRQHLHAHPELSFQEHQTTAYVEKQLNNLGITVKKGFTETGLVGYIYGNNPSHKTVALRADLDALPIEEVSDKAYISVHKGVMHACGHDVHTAALLGAAMILNAMKDSFEGTVQLIFQPGEEVLPGGASQMIAGGIFNSIQPSHIFAQHVFPNLESGKVGFRGGKYMAATDELHIEVIGKGGHAALPHQYNNPLLIAAELLIGLEHHFKPFFDQPEPTVLAFGKIEGKGATNVIPDVVELKGTLRTLDEKWRTEAHVIIVDICNAIAKKCKAEIKVNIVKGYPCLINDVRTTEKMKQAAQLYLGAENVVDLDLRMTAEDFAFFSQLIPSCFYRLGTGNVAKGIVANVHTATFDIDENALEIGMGLMAFGALNELKSKQP